MSPQVVAMIQAELDKVNARYAQVEQVKHFCDSCPPISPRRQGS